MRKLVLLFLLIVAYGTHLQAQVCDVNAGADQTVCNNVYGVWLNTATANDYVTWSSSGTGYFDDPYVTNPTYYPSSDDRNSSGVTLTVSNNQAFCTGGTIVDVMTVTFKVAPTLNVNTADLSVCATVASTQGISLFGSVKDASTFGWTTSGSGTFMPDASSVNANYVASAADISSGAISFTADAAHSNSCTASRNLDVTILSTPTIVVDADQNVCSNSFTNVYLNPISYSGGNSVIWTGGSAAHNPWGVASNYFPNATDIAAGSVTFTATITSACGTASDQIVYTIDQAYTLDAGVDRNICQGTTTLSFNALTNAPSISWSTSGSGTFSNTNTTTPVYNFTPAEQAGAFFYSFQADIPANGTCGAYTDYVNIYTITQPAINTGLDFTVCALQNAMPVAYPDYGIDNVMWSGGTGTWLSPGTTNPIYVPSAADRASGTVTLTVTGSGVCPNATDNVTVTFDSRVVDLTAGGPYTQYCSDAGPVTLNGSISGGFTGCQWSIIGWATGSFGDQFSATTTYTPGWADGNSTVRLELMANDPLSICGTVRDTISLVFNDPPYADWQYSYGSSTSFGACKGDTLWLKVENAQSVSWTANAGSGSFVGTSATESYTEFAPASTAQTVTFTLNATGLTGCSGITNQVVQANIHDYPTGTNAGLDAIICDPTSTYTMNGNPPPGSMFDGYWYYAYGGIAQEPKRIRQELSSGDVFFDDYSLYNTTASFQKTGAFDLVWAMTQRWADMDMGEGLAGCTSTDTVRITYVEKPVLVNDTIIAPSSLTVTKNVLANDNLYGLSYTVAETSAGIYDGENIVAFQPSTGTFSYLNRTPLFNGRDTLRYEVTITGCGTSQEATVIVNLVNGPPFTPDTSVVRTTVTKKPNTVTLVPLNLKYVFDDYNGNINWSSLTYISSTSGATFIPDNANRYDTLEYSSRRASVFTGEDVVTFSVCDNLGACYIGRYYIEVIPDYDNPSVKREDFVVINAVSPNGDGVNDFMYIYGISEYKTTVVIYNRWNQKVWEAENYDNNKVKFEGIGNQAGNTGVLPEGSYFYVVKNENKEQNGEQKGLQSGYLELRR